MGDGAKRQHAAITVPAPSAPQSATTIPDYDLQALATASSLEAMLPKASAPLALDLAVPTRTTVRPEGASLRAVFLLSHVDDRMSIAEIATTAQIPIHDATESFVALAKLGCVELRGADGHSSRPPESSEITIRPLAPSTVRNKQ